MYIVCSRWTSRPKRCVYSESEWALIWKKGLCRFNEASQDWDHSGFSGWALKSREKCPYKKKRHRHRGESPVTMEAEVGVMHLKPRNAPNCLEVSASGRGKEGFFSKPSEVVRPYKHLDSVQLSSKFLLF